MAELISMSIASLDGYVADRSGQFDWAAPDEEVHQFVNDLLRPVGTHLYGRRTYEIMSYWESHAAAAEPGVTGDFARIWQDAEKVVFSRTLHEVSSERTVLQHAFDPGAVRAMKVAADAPLSIGGPMIAGEAFRVGLIDVCHVILMPVTVGGGTPVFPHDLKVDLDLVEHRRFASGAVHLHYRCR
jgi:dihydrofolate reductase